MSTTTDLIRPDRGQGAIPIHLVNKDGFEAFARTLHRLLEVDVKAIVPGHGDVGDRAFVVRSMVEIRTIAELARLVHEETLGIDDAVLRTAYPADAAREPLERALAQLRGELD